MANTPTDNVLFSVRIPRAQLEQLHRLKVRDGVALSEQVRRALKLWFAQQQPKKGKA
jgi:hypothetical protein